MSTDFVASVEVKYFFMLPTNNPINGRRGYFVKSKRQDAVKPSRSEQNGSCDSYNTILDADLGSFFDPNFSQSEKQPKNFSNSSIKSELKVPISNETKLDDLKAKATTKKNPSAKSKNNSSNVYVIPHLRGDRDTFRSPSKVTECPLKNYSHQKSQLLTSRNGGIISNTNRNHSPKNEPPVFSDLAFESDRIHNSLHSRTALKSPSKTDYLPNSSFPLQKATSYSLEGSLADISQSSSKFQSDSSSKGYGQNNGAARPLAAIPLTSSVSSKSFASRTESPQGSSQRKYFPRDANIGNKFDTPHETPTYFKRLLSCPTVAIDCELSSTQALAGNHPQESFSRKTQKHEAFREDYDSKQNSHKDDIDSLMGHNPNAETWAIPTGRSYNSEATRPSVHAIPDRASGHISHSFRNTKKEFIEHFNDPGITPLQNEAIHNDQSTEQASNTQPLTINSIDSEVYVGSFFDLEKAASLIKPPATSDIYSLGIIPSPYQAIHTIPNAHNEAPTCNWETLDQTNWDDPWFQEPVTPKQDKWSLWDDDVSSKAVAHQNSTSNHIPFAPGLNSFGVERSLQVSSSLQVENDSKEWREPSLLQQPSFKGERVNSTWEIVQQVGRGSFGEVFLGVNIVDPHQPTVAIKRETSTSSPPRLEREYEIYQMLAGYNRIPKIHFYGLLQNSNVLVMDLLGPTIKHLRAHSARIRLSAVLEIGIQLIDIMEQIHAKGVAYRDVKPDNFLLDLDCACFSDSVVELSLFAREYFFESETYDPTDELPYFFDLPTEARPSPTLYAVDFGLSEKLQDSTKLRGLSPGTKIRKHTGTAKYASLSTHRGYVAGPLDDLESVGYVLVDLLNGELPWDRSVKKGLRSHSIWFSVERAKRRTRIPTLCHHLPEGFIDYFTYVREASRGSPPDYQFLRSVLRNIYTEEHPLRIIQDLSD